ncbi:hypothetical protein KY290_000851 [Solanum tuberosum]|uniref:Basic proline-rich protein-like n=1 Tax=Solanum tuberosum TaxID=4113 RepID=A0ABQ7WKI3_SOLTU|nr:hypothetical protein KY289_000909 [Solanum tuberosum]KAH0781253.1 hypothetical protein KY290_000851 [Solanum tuberosum]
MKLNFKDLIHIITQNIYPNVFRPLRHRCPASGKEASKHLVPSHPPGTRGVAPKVPPARFTSLKGILPRGTHPGIEASHPKAPQPRPPASRCLAPRCLPAPSPGIKTSNPEGPPLPVTRPRDPRRLPSPSTDIVASSPEVPPRGVLPQGPPASRRLPPRPLPHPPASRRLSPRPPRPAPQP